MSTDDHRAARAAYMREYNSDPERRAKKQKRDRDYAASHREEAKERASTWYSRNKDRQLARLAEYRRQIAVIAQEAKSQPCQRCGLRFPWYAMEFHHRDPLTKKGEVCNRSTVNLALIELAKCDVVCGTCHNIIEYEAKEQVNG